MSRGLGPSAQKILADFDEMERIGNDVTKEEFQRILDQLISIKPYKLIIESTPHEDINHE